VERLVLIAIGELELRWLELLHDRLPGLLGRRCRIDPHALDPAPAANGPRRQYDAGMLVEMLAARVGGPDERALGVGWIDLYLSVFTFVYGAAHLNGRAGVVSLHRLDPSRYAVSGGGELLAERLLKEASHECGHLFGAVHCSVPACVMNFSGAVEEIDLKNAVPCPDCAREIGVPKDLGPDQGA
jgi:archaemetzincin